MAYTDNARVYVPQLKYIHIRRFFANHPTQFGIGRSINHRKLVSKTFFLNNSVTSNVQDPNSNTQYTVHVGFRSSKIVSYYDIDIDDKKTFCDCCNQHPYCANVAACLISLIDKTSTTNENVPCMLLVIYI